MSKSVISVENLSKTYRLGQIGTGTFTNDLKLWWSKARGKPNPLLRIGEKDYGNRDGEDLWALRDVSFRVEQGEVLGIIGRNGAGKSTLLKILSRVTAPTSGKIKVKGKIASLLEVGTGFHPDLTGRENIYLNGAILGMRRKEIDRKFEEIVDFSEVDKFIDTPVKRYSSGMYVRLAFAVAAHLDPEILLVDEVLAVGDADFQKKCMGKMGGVAKEGRTVLFVSHNMGSIGQLCTKTILLDSGFLKLYDVTRSVIDTYSKDSNYLQADFRVFDHRDGDHRIVLKGVKTFNQSGIKTDTILSNSSVSFEIEFEKMTLDDCANVAVEVKIIDIYGQILCTFSTHLTNQNFNNIPQKGKFYCSVPQIPLAPNTYIVLLHCYVNGILSDLVEKASTLTIIGNEQTGVVLNYQKIAHGIVLTPSEWALDSKD